MKIEPRKFSFSLLDINGEHYLYLTFKHKQLDIIPDNFRCEFIKNNILDKEKIEKTCYNLKEYFNITDIGAYIIYKDNKLFHKITSYIKWDYDIKEEEEDLFVSYN